VIVVGFEVLSTEFYVVVLGFEVLDEIFKTEVLEAAGLIVWRLKQ